MNGPDAAPNSERRWYFAYCDREEVGNFLDEGWEPFAIDARGSGVGLGRQVTVYLKIPADVFHDPKAHGV